MGKPRVFIALPTFSPRDAVGNDALGMWHSLRAAGYDARIYATWIESPYQRHAKKLDPSDRSLWSSSSDILIYHHAIYWEAGEVLLAKAKTKVAIKYHNVTPPEFFERYSQHHFEACTRGLEATRRIVRHPEAWFWGDSAFNVSHLIESGAVASRCRVVPPFHRIEEELAQAPFDSVITGDHRQSRFNFLFVGGIRPNKGHFKAVDVFAAYRLISAAPSRLTFVGNFDDTLRRYVNDIRAHAAQHGVSEHVRLHFSVTPSQLRAYYLTSTVFLCTSDHEGFCVPLVESMFFRVPIVAWASTAIAETCADAGILLQQFDAVKMAELIDDSTDDSTAVRLLAQRGRARYDTEFQPDIIATRFLRLVEELERQ
jgi:glycosyltransferase involved in cell wall biosynthesis